MAVVKLAMLFRESREPGEVVPMPRLPVLSSRSLSVSEPVVFLVSKARYEAGEVVETLERAESILAVEVELPPVSSALNRIAEPMPAKPPLADDRCSKVKRLLIDEEAVSLAEIVRDEVAVIEEPVKPP